MDYGDFSTLSIKVSERVAWLTIDHPPINLFDMALISDMAEAGTKLAEDDGVVAFIGDTAGSQRDKVVYRCDPANCPSVALPEVLAIEGDVDVVGDIINRFESIGIDNSQNVTFNARAETPSGDRKHGILYWNEGAGFVESLVLKEDAVVNASAPSTFSKIFNNRISPGGLVSFRAKIKFLAGGKAVGIYQFQ